MTAPTRHARYTHWIDQRAGLARRQTAVFAVTIGAHRRTRHAARHGLAVDAASISLGDLGMTRPARGGHIRAIDPRARVAPRLDGVAGMAIGAGGGFVVTGGDGAS